jgi:multiple sugar transport system permease protein
MVFMEPDMKLKLKMSQREALAFYLLVAPWVVGFLVFQAGPILASLGFSLTRYDVIQPPRWVGLGNFQEMLFNDPLFWQALKVTAYYTLLAVPLGMVVALLLAVLLNQRVPALPFFRTIFYLPSVIAGVAVSLLWIWLLNPTFGLINYGLRVLFGIQGPKWLLSSEWVIPSFVLMSLWGAGVTVIIYLASLQGVPTTLYEAAELDGANRWRRFRHVTIPMISPVILFTFITGMIGAFQVFTQAYIMTGGGPNYASLMYSLYIYQNAFRYFRMGYASALAWVLFAMIMALTLLTFRLSSNRVYYETGDAR